MSTTHPPDALALQQFFDAVRRDEANAHAELEQFFKRFDQAYSEARVARAATTPHFNVLRVFGLEFRELRHSDALAWFLETGAEHEQGPLFAAALLQLVGCSQSPGDSYTVRREKHGRTDVACYAPGQFAVFIENKVRHFERDKQVSDMVNAMTALSDQLGVPRERRFAVFLTDTGQTPVSGPKSNSEGFLCANLKAVSRVQLFEAFRAALEAQQTHSPLLLNFLDAYLESIRRIRSSLT